MFLSAWCSKNALKPSPLFPVGEAGLIDISILSLLMLLGTVIRVVIETKRTLCAGRTDRQKGWTKRGGGVGSKTIAVRK